MTNSDKIIRIKILGCGAAMGVPAIGCKCKVCKSNNSKNHRMRQSIYIEHKTTKILIDSGPDFRKQCLDNNISRLDGILLTHPHPDHIGGLWDVCAMAFIENRTIDIYLDQNTAKVIQGLDTYLLWTKFLRLHIIEPDKLYRINDIEFYPFEQNHGQMRSLGFKIGNFAYSTDLDSLNEQTFEFLKGIGLWLIECHEYLPIGLHMHLERTLAFIEKAQAKQSVLIHMSHNIDYDEISNRLPKNVCAAHDGMTIESETH